MHLLKYLWYVLKHKWFVLIECWKRGLFLRGLTHDLSKLRPSEFFPYANYFYGKKDTTRRNKSGYYKPYDTGDDAFDYAWLLHQKRNKHHWQYWVLPKDDGFTKVFPMPHKARVEMLCDWIGAGRALKTKGVTSWYPKNKNNMTLHIATRKWIEGEINDISS